MTTQKIIDNIQTRLENLISERFTGTYQNIDISCSDYNPTIDTNVTITITVTDQNDDPISGFTVPLKIDGTSISGITTNSSGVATYTYTCTEWGNHKISVKSVSTFINVTGWKEIALTNGTLWVNGAERICEAHFSKSTEFGAANSWTYVATESEIANYPPKSSASNISQHYVSCSTEPVIARIFPTGSVQALSRNANQTQSVTFSTMWHY